MSESWKNRLWSLLLVCKFAVVLSVCNKAMDSSSGGSSSSGTAFADWSTVTISSMPSLSFASNQVAISSQALPNISAVLFCVAMQSTYYNNGVTYYTDCDASNDDSSITAAMNLTTDNNGILPFDM